MAGLQVSPGSGRPVNADHQETRIPRTDMLTVVKHGMPMVLRDDMRIIWLKSLAGRKSRGPSSSTDQGR